MKLERQNQFDKTLQVRVPKTFVDELDEAATRRMVNRTDYIRMALQDRLWRRSSPDLMSKAENTAGKQRGKPFQKGQSGNPDGRPKGSRNATTLALENLLDGQATALTQKAIDLALAGDMAALRLCLDRILPPRKDRPVTFTLPPIDSAQDAAATVSAVLAAVAAGDLTPTDAGEISKLIEAYVKALETAELAERLERLERMTSQ
jgi:hypothetical protein